MTTKTKTAPTSQDFDREFRAQVAQMTAGLAPTAFTSAWADWAMHMALAPAKRAELRQDALVRAQDTWAFALGAGIAGLAGCALSQIGNVGPDLGQSYIVDSFMVVVLGGVGQLWGAVVAGLGLGVLTKLFEGWQGAVLAKIMVLVLIVLFIQKRPSGIFALKGRSADA